VPKRRNEQLRTLRAIGDQHDHGATSVVVKARTPASTGRVVPMTVRTDPEGDETRALLDLVDLRGAEVLEIGSGDGRLTWRYADRAARVTAIEPFEDSIARARERLPDPLQERVEFRHVALEDFVARSEADVFDVALLSWSLC
jgi:2-polyprenyl-3-methyl-5-hydroxy-6-metoxy-1,4-benzoquinol methylase